jgi:hypothetical protein
MITFYINFFRKRKLIHTQESDYYCNHSYLFNVATNNPAKNMYKSRLDLLYSRNKLKNKNYKNSIRFKEVISGYNLHNQERPFGNLMYFLKNKPIKSKLQTYNPDSRTKNFLIDLDIWNKKSFYLLGL